MINYIKDTTYRYFALDAARQLGYGDKVVSQIRAAKDDAEIERIMVTARKRLSDADI